MKEQRAKEDYKEQQNTRHNNKLEATLLRTPAAWRDPRMMSCLLKFSQNTFSDLLVADMLPKVTLFIFTAFGHRLSMFVEQRSLKITNST